MPSLSKSAIYGLTILGAGVITAGAVTYLYDYYHRRDLGRRFITEDSRGRRYVERATCQQLDAIQETTIIELRIPKDKVADLIGKRGANIKQIQTTSNTRINFNDDDDDESKDRICKIRGFQRDASLAVDLINKFIMSQPEILTLHIYVPIHSIGRIIGRGGDSIRGIQDTSQAKVKIADNEYDENEDDIICESQPKLMKKITLKGTQIQIETAKNLIHEKVVEEEHLRNRINRTTALRPKRMGNPVLNVKSPVSSEPPSQIAIPSKIRINGFIEVLVSYVVSPNKFWFQVMGKESIELDKLNDKITKVYSNRDEEYEERLEVGQLVIAPYEDDSKIYRAKIIQIFETEAEIFFIDYGFQKRIDLKLLMDSRPAYNHLGFQAIEATLNLKSLSGDEEWKEAAIEKFIDLSYCAQWKGVTAIVKGFFTVETRQVIWVELMDKDLNIGDEIIKSGHAFPNEEKK